jgi:hypothetical protein
MLHTTHLPTPEDDPLLLLEECALLARVSVPTIRRRIAAGLPALRSGRVLVRRSDLLAHMEQGRCTTDPIPPTTTSDEQAVADE